MCTILWHICHHFIHNDVNNIADAAKNSRFEVRHTTNDKMCIEMYDKRWKISTNETKLFEIYGRHRFHGMMHFSGTNNNNNNNNYYYYYYNNNNNNSFTNQLKCAVRNSTIVTAPNTVTDF